MIRPVLARKHYWLIAAVLAMLICFIVFNKWEEDWYRKQIPGEIETADVVVVEGESGLRRGCGVAVFKLTARAQARLSADGLAALAESSPFTGHPWTETPYVETGDGMTLEDRWLGGLACAHLDASLSEKIHNALKGKGAFVRKLYEAGVIVIPSSGLVALVYFG